MQFELLADPKAHEAWFRRKVEEALGNDAPPVRHQEVEARVRRATESDAGEVRLSLDAAEAG